MGGADGDDADIDERQGVAVTFDDEAGDEELENEVRDVSSEDEDDEDEENEDGVAQATNGDADGDDEMILDSGPVAGKQKDKEKHSVPARDIDAFWLQRQVGSLYPDAHEQTDKTKDALRILSGEPDEAGSEEKSLREIENDLMELFDFEHHELVQKLVENREKVFWLTKLTRSENDEQRAEVEREMASEGLQWILNELHGKKANDGKKMDIKMDIDVPDSIKADALKEEKPEGQLVGGLQPRKLINLDNLVFDQGNHLMTNAKVRLPEGSTKRSFKGYEEIHVPPPRSRTSLANHSSPSQISQSGLVFLLALQSR
uniref:Brr2 N-terminal helicase PWI domain-containing protein n=1 Tax=Bionectria ochroleuca TaxID=29856 RepID=A0A8H7ND89_BIOOC